MGQFFEFAQVLEAKIRSEIESAYERNAKFEDSETSSFPYENESFPMGTDVLPAGMAWLMGEIPRNVDFPSEKATAKARNAYGVKAKPRPNHVLDADQANAFIFMKTYVSELNLSFSARELKTAFRKAALITHPDQGGNADLFRELQSRYATLLTVFTQKP